MGILVERRCMERNKKEQCKNRKRGNTRNAMRRLKAAMLACITALTVGIVSVPQEGGRVLAAGKAVDSDTATTYQQVFDGNNPPEHAGQVWTDKSVYSTDAQFSLQEGAVSTVTNDSDFLVAYSALAGAQIVHGQTKVPVDAVFVIDLSGSMTSQMDPEGSRISNTVQALNTAIGKVMAMNPYTRVGVVGFNGTAAVLLPLDHYTQNKTTEYFRLTGENTNPPTLNYEAVGSNHAVLAGSMAVSGGTNIQCGIYEGMKLLSTAASTSASIDGREVKRIPSVILLSDGAPTYSSDSKSWWTPSNNNNQGPGNSPYAGNGIKAMMTASYMKAEIDRHYAAKAGGFPTSVYTVGMGITGLTGGERDLADLTLHPSAYWDSKTDTAKTIREKWEAYASGSNPTVDVNRKESYMLNHPASNDVVSIKDYVDAYYDADDSATVADVFDKIVEDIVLTGPDIPTKLQGDDPTNDGFLTYTDPIGAYMEVKDVKALLYGGAEYRKKDVSESGNTVTYTFDGSITSEVYGQQNIGLIQIMVTTDENQNQTLTVKIPAAAIPLHISTIVQNKDGSVKSITDNGAVPLRVLYTVGVRKDVLADGYVSADKVNASYLSENTNKDGTVNFYSNLYTGTNTVYGEEAGNATVEFQPSGANPYYYNPEDGTLFTSHITEAKQIKQENFTSTAGSSHALDFVYEKDNPNSKAGVCVNYLGNNGVLKLPISKEPKPTEPTEPTKPTEPSTPDPGPSQNNNTPAPPHKTVPVATTPTNGKVSSVKTGDEAQVAGFVILCSTALAAALTIVLVRKRHFAWRRRKN